MVPGQHPKVRKVPRKRGRTRGYRLPAQLELGEKVSGRGGRREGAGRPPGRNPRIRHRARVSFSRMTAVHVTVKMAPHVYNLRSRRSFRVIERALYYAAHNWKAVLVKFTVQGNHVHLLVEAPDHKTLARCVQGFSIRTAKGLNRLMATSGRVFADRYHCRLVKTPTEARRVIRYLASNARKHANRRDEKFQVGWIDPYSSEAKDLSFTLPPAKNWLLRAGWQRGKP